MKCLSLLLAVLMVLGLLVATTGPGSADKPGSPPGREKEGGKTPPGQEKKGDDAPDWVPPGQEKKGDDAGLADQGQPKVTICHKPGTPAEKTLVVAAPAEAAHLAHGDTLGACPEIGEPEPPPIVPSAAVTVTLWHKPGTPAEKTLVVAAAAEGGHLTHGDSSLALSVKQRDSRRPERRR